MKISRYVLIFTLIFVTYFVITHYSTTRFSYVVNQKTEINNAIDGAIDSAMESIVLTASGYDVDINFEQCASNFYKSLYAGFAAIDNNVTQSKLDLYTPVLAITDVDGLYIYYSEVIDNEVRKVWSSKIPYAYSGIVVDGSTTYSFIMHFGLNDDITIFAESYNSVTSETSANTYTGVYGGLSQTYPITDRKGNKHLENAPLHEILELGPISTYEDFVNLRSTVVTDTVTSQMSYYVNNHNRIAEMYGEQFTFQLPSSAESEIARGITDINFICFFQGYPIGTSTTDRYSNFEISGARIAKNSGYVTQEMDEYLYYHKVSCTHGRGTRKYFETREECALRGALPCPYCRP